jgi:hypothetical protein
MKNPNISHFDKFDYFFLMVKKKEKENSPDMATTSFLTLIRAF